MMYVYKTLCVSWGGKLECFWGGAPSIIEPNEYIIIRMYSASLHVSVFLGREARVFGGTIEYEHIVSLPSLLSGRRQGQVRMWLFQVTVLPWP